MIDQRVSRRNASRFPRNAFNADGRKEPFREHVPGQPPPGGRRIFARSSRRMAPKPRGLSFDTRRCRIPTPSTKRAGLGTTRASATTIGRRRCRTRCRSARTAAARRTRPRRAGAHAITPRANPWAVGVSAAPRVFAAQGSAFTCPRPTNQRSWLYRIAPSVCQEGYTPRPAAKPPAPPQRLTASFPVVNPTPMRWRPMPIPDDGAAVDFVDGLATMAGAGSPQLKDGVAIHVSRCPLSIVRPPGSAAARRPAQPPRPRLPSQARRAVPPQRADDGPRFCGRWRPDRAAGM